MAALPPIDAGADMSDALERRLRPLALCAHAGDLEARDALYAAMLPKLERMSWRVPPSRSAAWDRDDVAQEGWLVFARLVRTWDPARGPFGRYVLARFGWRLQDAIRRGIGRPTTPPRTIVDRDADLDDVKDDRASEAFAAAELRVLAGGLESKRAALLLGHVGDGEPLGRIGQALGLSSRSTTRYWRDVRLELAG